ncbi:MAG: 3-dehydroquinate dehydratase [Bacteroidales bacterium]|jgi:3-dehydroquinate dehydratase-2|nr:3-dehydroquinate dehydratase [Bacteroidales bacterium]
MKRVLIINGANLNLLGTREVKIYGDRTFEDYLLDLREKYPHFDIHYFQSNLEGEVVNALQTGANYDAIVLNAGGYAHTSVVIRDAVAAISHFPVIEVHISNIMQRETFRHSSLLSAVCAGTIFGFGLLSYELAMKAIESWD